MSVMDKLINAVKFNDDQYEDDEEMDNEYYSTGSSSSEDKRTSSSQSRARKRTSSPSYSSYDRDRDQYEDDHDDDTADSSMPRRRRSYGGPGKELRIIRPKSIEDARTVSDILLRDSVVILNLEGLDVGLAQRIIDFASGACYAVDGHVMKISHYIFVVTPSDVDVSGDISNPATPGSKDASVTLKMPVTGRNN